jgi:maleylpyruvate isomerase
LNELRRLRAVNNRYLPRIDAATKRLSETVSRLDDEAADGASLLPDWDRSMVVTHLSANADGVRRAVEAAARGDIGEVYPGGKAARDAEIEAGRALPARELQARLRGSCEQLWSVLEAAPDEVWSSPAIGSSGEVPVGTGLIVARLREVEVHHVDLVYGYGPDDWPFGWALEEMERAMLDLPAGLPAGMAVVLTASDAGQHWVAGSGSSLEIAGTTGELFAWVTGRASHVGGFEAPVLKPWR